MKITFNSPYTLNPTQAVTCKALTTTIDHDRKAARILVEFRDSNGNVVQHREVTVSGAAFETWLGNQEATLHNSVLSKLAVAGTVGA